MPWNQRPLGHHTKVKIASTNWIIVSDNVQQENTVWSFCCVSDNHVISLVSFIEQSPLDGHFFKMIACLGEESLKGEL